jgi:hypothetical protein
MKRSRSFKCRRPSSASPTNRLIACAPWLPPKIRTVKRGSFLPSGGLSSRNAARIGFPVICVRRAGNHLRDAAKDSGGQSRKNILFGDGGRRPHDAGGEDRRPRGVSPHAENDCRLEFAEDTVGGDKARRDLRERPRCPERAPSLEPLRGDGTKGKLQSAQDPFFQTPLGADKEDAVPRVSPEELFGDGDPREEMAACPAAGDDHPEAAAAFLQPSLIGDRFSASVAIHGVLKNYQTSQRSSVI